MYVQVKTGLESNVLVQGKADSVINRYCKEYEEVKGSTKPEGQTFKLESVGRKWLWHLKIRTNSFPVQYHQGQEKVFLHTTHNYMISMFGKVNGKTLPSPYKISPITSCPPISLCLQCK